MDRRTFLGVAWGAVAADISATATSIPIIDTHIHLFDPRRPQGVPWPEKTDAVLYHPALPDRYRKIATPLGIVGAIELEPSPWLEDNQGSHDVAAQDTTILGTVGDAAAHRAYAGNLRELGKRPQVYVKISEVLRRVDGRVPEDLNFYRPRLDELWEIFGEDRLLYGSDWPNSDLWAQYPQVLK